MPAISKTGSNMVVAFSLPKSVNPDADGRILINAPSVQELTLNFSLNAMPTGHAVCVLNFMVEVPVGGSYGIMHLKDTNTDTKDIDISIYIQTMRQTPSGSNSVKISFDFVVGSRKSDMKMLNFACTGTSIAAMKECITKSGLEAQMKYSDNGKNADLMTWRLVNGNLEENMNYIVAHSYVPSDILFWSFDETRGRIVVSTFNTEKVSKTRSFLFYSHDAMASTANAVYRPKSMAGTSVFKYMYMERGDNTSMWRGEMFPNLIVDTTNSKGEKETGDCGGDCIDVIMNAAGANPVPQSMRPPKDSAGVYGEPNLAMAFPQNGHKKYAVADTIRGRLMSEYGRVARVRISNHLGPPVGSCVYLVAYDTKIKEGNLEPDRDFTARYIVLSKLVNKVTDSSVGALGNKAVNMTAEYETYLELATNFPFAKNPAKEYTIVSDAVKNVLNAVEGGK